MLNIGMGELMVVAILGLVVVGPERLPEVMRFLGRNYAKLKHATSDLRKAFQFEVDKAQGEHRAELIKARRELLKAKAEADALKESISASVQRPNPNLEPPTLQPSDEAGTALTAPSGAEIDDES
jgi:sec-independent protein translocase protein TatB